MNRPYIAGSIVAAYADLGAHMAVWWQIAAVPMVVMMGATVVQLLLPASGVGGVFLILCRVVVFAAMEASILIAWTRAADSAFTVVDDPLKGEPTRSEGRVIVWYVGLSVLLCGVPSAILAQPGTPASAEIVAATAILLTLKARLGFFFVEQSLERPSPSAPWMRVTGGSYWALCLSVLFAHIPLFAVLSAISWAGHYGIDRQMLASLVALILSGLSPALVAGVALFHWRADRARHRHGAYSATIFT